MLYWLGCCVLLRRAAEMVRCGILRVERSGGGYRLQTTDKAIATQFLDRLEFQRLEALEKSIWGGKSFNPLEHWKRSDLPSLMQPLIYPWDSGAGIMASYKALPEVDAHFLAEAAHFVRIAQSDAGIHPDLRFNELTGEVLSGVAAFVASFHMKHVTFTLHACEQLPEVSPVQSLTIWKPRSELIQSLVDYSGLPERLASQALDALSVKTGDTELLAKHTTPLRPLLIDLGNGMDLRPVASVMRNPFHTVRTIQEWRDPTIRNRISEPREDWMRADIYGLFQGDRYLRVNGNIKVRKEGAIATDVDGAILDRTSGELALLQIKWQDFYTNDVRQLRSKAKNFVQGMDDWASIVEEWLTRLSDLGLKQSLRLRDVDAPNITKVYLFGVGRSGARFKGYGFETKHQMLALANWPQFARARYEVGPTDNVFQKLHARLRLEMEDHVEPEPEPMSVELFDHEIHFADLWSKHLEA